MGFEGFMRCKGGEIFEGEVIFFRKSKFLLIIRYDIVLKEVFFNDLV